MARRQPEHEAPAKQDRESRKKRAKRLIAAIRVRVNLICGRVDALGDLADQVQSVVDDLRTLTNDPSYSQLFSADVRTHIDAAADRFEAFHRRIDQAESACDDVRKALDLADKALATTSWLGGKSIAALATLAAGAVVAAVFLANQAGGDSGPGNAGPTGTPFAAPSGPVAGSIEFFGPSLDTVFSDAEPRCTTLSWDVQDALAVRLDEDEVEPAGSLDVCPAETTRWVLTADFADGSSDRQVATVSVEASAEETEIFAEILRPNDDTSGIGPNTGYDGFDRSAGGNGLWFKDVGVVGRAIDANGQVYPDARLTWTTDRADIQDTRLGAGESAVVRLYSDVCEGSQHTLQLTGTHPDGTTATAERLVFIGQVC